MSISRGNVAQVTGLWVVLSVLRWLAALPINQPRIFRDEFVHWTLGRSFAFHIPFTLSRERIDYPAVVYPSLLRPVFLVGDPHVGFHLAQGLNAFMVSAVVFAAYLLAREFSGHRNALVVAALAGLAPGGVYSALIMEESAYYPLFVLSCWLCLRVLARGQLREALACAVAFTATYFAKPLAVPLVIAYAVTVMAWAVTELRASQSAHRDRIAALATRLLPALLFGVVLVVRSALAARHFGVQGGPESQGLLGRFYAEEMRGPLLPSLGPYFTVVASLVLALTMGIGVAPVAALFDGWRSRLADSPRRWLVVFTICVAGIYVLAAARHTMVINSAPKIHERYVFAVGPLLLTLFLAAESAALGIGAIAVVCAAVGIAFALLADVALQWGSWVSAPSLTLASQLHTRIDDLWIGLVMASMAAFACVGARRAGGTIGGTIRRLPRAASLAALLLLLNAAWYVRLYRIQVPLQPFTHVIEGLEANTRPRDAITLVVDEDAEPMSLVAWYAKFWLQERATVYWTGQGGPPWYADAIGPVSDAVRRTRPTHLVGLSGITALCPEASPVPAAGADPRVHVLAVPADGCGSATVPERDAAR